MEAVRTELNMISPRKPSCDLGPAWYHIAAEPGHLFGNPLNCHGPAMTAVQLAQELGSFWAWLLSDVEHDVPGERPVHARLSDEREMARGNKRLGVGRLSPTIGLTNPTPSIRLPKRAAGKPLRTAIGPRPDGGMRRMGRPSIV